jgi:HSP20 family protein
MSWDHWREVQAWRDRLDRLSNLHRDSWAPPIDVYETADSYVITAEVPGLTREQIDVQIEDSRLTIRGRRVDPGPRRSTAVHYHQIERGHGAFARTFDFPEAIDREGVTADLTNGVLSVTLRKLPPRPARRIAVR